MRGGAPPGGARRKASPAPPRRPSRQDAPSLHTRHNAASVQLGTRREVAGGGEWGRESSASRARSTDVGRGGHLRTLHPRSPWLHSHFEQLTSCSQAKPLNSRACNNKAVPGHGAASILLWMNAINRARSSSAHLVRRGDSLPCMLSAERSEEIPRLVDLRGLAASWSGSREIRSPASSTLSSTPGN